MADHRTSKEGSEVIGLGQLVTLETVDMTLYVFLQALGVLQIYGYYASGQ